MSSPIQLIVGLANPGKEYADTRHNAGAWFIDALLQNSNAKLKAQAKFHGLYTQIELHGNVCHLLIPTTFMNLSGQSVRACMTYHKISPSGILVAHDEIDLPAGTIRLKLDGGDGGHNGLKDIIRNIHTKQFYRLRIGVGRPTAEKDVVDYVLHKPSKVERSQIDTAIEKAEDTLPLILEGHIQKAMHQLHTNTNE